MLGALEAILLRVPNGTACFKNCKQLLEYQHLLLETFGGQSSVTAKTVVFLHLCLILSFLFTRPYFKGRFPPIPYPLHQTNLAPTIILFSIPCRKQFL